MKLNHLQGENWMRAELESGDTLNAELLDKIYAIAESSNFPWYVLMSLSLDEYAASKELLASKDWAVAGTTSRNIDRQVVTFINVKKAIRRSLDGKPRKPAPDIQTVKRPEASEVNPNERGEWRER